MDRVQFDALREELEKQLRALAKRLSQMNRDYTNLDDDAAGIRKYDACADQSFDINTHLVHM